MTTIYHFKNADISIGNNVILRNITWDLKRGNHTWVSGLNASGKTTLCKSLAGHLRITKGHASPKGIGYENIKMVSFTDAGKLFHSANTIHYYQQRFNAWDADGYLTAQEYLKAKGINPFLKEHKRFLDDIGLSDFLQVERIKLSSGQTRKLLLAGALLHRPELLILDNPYMGLDNSSRTYLNTFLDQLANQYKVTILVSGQTDELPECIRYQLNLNEGKIDYLGTLRPKTSSNCDPNVEILKELKSYYYSINPVESISNVLHFENINVGYKDQFIIQNFRWKIGKGEKWVLFGPNGSGKSTIVSLIYADHPQVYSQRISIFGKKPGVGCSIWDVKKNIGFTSPELHSYFRTDYKASEVTFTGATDNFELETSVKQSIQEFSLTLFKYFNIYDQFNIKFSQLSTGHQRICLLIRALIKCPPLLLLDEPFQGLDDENINLSKRLLDSIIRKDQTLIFISHFKNEVPSCVTKSFNL